jgi:hypothetical protein
MSKDEDWQKIKEDLMRSGHFVGGGCGPVIEWLYQQILELESRLTVSSVRDQSTHMDTGSNASREK